VESVGPGLWWSWLDRDLSLVGTALLKAGDLVNVFVEQTVALIPSLATHLNPGVGIKPNFEMARNFRPIFHVNKSPDSPTDDFLKSIVAKSLNIPEDDIIDYDVSLMPNGKATICIENDLISSYRASVLAPAIVGLDSFVASKNPERGLNCFIAFDESASAGPKSSFLREILERIGCDSSFYRRSLLICNHNVANVNTLFMDSTNLGSGCLYLWDKGGVNWISYEGLGKLKGAAQRGGVELKQIVVDKLYSGQGMVGLVNEKLGISAVHVGIPVMGWRSVRELISWQDVVKLRKLVDVLYQDDVLR
jgi:aspartyl aminopeptidase